MVILLALVESLVSKGILHVEDASEIKDLYSLSAFLDKRSDEHFTMEERVYLDAVNLYLEEGLYSKVKELVVPASMRKFSETLNRTIPLIPVKV